jgi:nucleoid DNA-binding protein
MNKNEFIRIWAKRSNLSIKDATAIWREFEQIVSECVDTQEELHLKGFGHLHYVKREVPPHHDIKTRTWVTPDPENKIVKKVIFSLSRNLKDLMIEDPTKRRLYMTRQAELRRKGLLEEAEEDVEDYELEDDEFNEEE